MAAKKHRTTSKVRGRAQAVETKKPSVREPSVRRPAIDEPEPSYETNSVPRPGKRG